MEGRWLRVYLGLERKENGESKISVEEQISKPERSQGVRDARKQLA